jgi:hypothetical protein
MTTPMLRGYTIKQTYGFLESGYYAPDVQRRLVEGLPGDLKAFLPTIKPAEWYPREHMTVLLRAVAAVKNDDAGSYTDLVAAGSHVASEAMNTFLRILMKMMTPSLYCKKTPELWARDHRGSGTFDIDLSNADKNTIVMKYLGGEGFDHIGAAAIGFMTFGFNAMGKKDFQVTQKGWSLATPSPSEVVYHLTWK